MIDTADTTSTVRPTRADIDRSPVILLASLYAARRSGDVVLESMYRNRLADIGIRIVFTGAADAPATDAPPAPVRS